MTKGSEKCFLMEYTFQPKSKNKSSITIRGDTAIFVLVSLGWDWKFEKFLEFKNFITQRQKRLERAILAINFYGITLHSCQVSSKLKTQASASKWLQLNVACMTISDSLYIAFGRYNIIWTCHNMVRDSIFLSF